jgi:hypothetical protein
MVALILARLDGRPVTSGITVADTAPAIRSLA